LKNASGTFPGLPGKEILGDMVEEKERNGSGSGLGVDK